MRIFLFSFIFFINISVYAGKGQLASAGAGGGASAGAGAGAGTSAGAGKGVSAGAGCISVALPAGVVSDPVFKENLSPSSISFEDLMRKCIAPIVYFNIYGSFHMMAELEQIEKLWESISSSVKPSDLSEEAAKFSTPASYLYFFKEEKRMLSSIRAALKGEAVYGPLSEFLLRLYSPETRAAEHLDFLKSYKIDDAFFYGDRDTQLSIETKIERILKQVLQYFPNHVFRSHLGEKRLSKSILFYEQESSPLLSKRLVKYLKNTAKVPGLDATGRPVHARFVFMLTITIMNPELFGPEEEGYKDALNYIDNRGFLSDIIVNMFPEQPVYKIVFDPLLYIINGDGALHVLLQPNAFPRFQPVVINKGDFPGIGFEYGSYRLMPAGTTLPTTGRILQEGEIYFTSGAAAGPIARIFLYAQARGYLRLEESELAQWRTLDASNPVMMSEYVWNEAVKAQKRAKVIEIAKAKKGETKEGEEESGEESGEESEEESEEGNSFIEERIKLFAEAEATRIASDLVSREVIEIAKVKNKKLAKLSKIKDRRTPIGKGMKAGGEEVEEESSHLPAPRPSASSLIDKKEASFFSGVSTRDDRTDFEVDDAGEDWHLVPAIKKGSSTGHASLSKGMKRNVQEKKTIVLAADSVTVQSKTVASASSQREKGAGRRGKGRKAIAVTREASAAPMTVGVPESVAVVPAVENHLEAAASSVVLGEASAAPMTVGVPESVTFPAVENHLEAAASSVVLGEASAAPVTMGSSVSAGRQHQMRASANAFVSTNSQPPLPLDPPPAHHRYEASVLVQLPSEIVYLPSGEVFVSDSVFVPVRTQVYMPFFPRGFVPPSHFTLSPRQGGYPPRPFFRYPGLGGPHSY